MHVFGTWVPGTEPRPSLRAASAFSTESHLQFLVSPLDNDWRRLLRGSPVHLSSHEKQWRGELLTLFTDHPRGPFVHQCRVSMSREKTSEARVAFPAGMSSRQHPYSPFRHLGAVTPRKRYSPVGPAFFKMVKRVACHTALLLRSQLCVSKISPIKTQTLC